MGKIKSFLGRNLSFKRLNPNPIRVCILGQKFSGKTCLYNYLQKIYEIPRESEFGAIEVDDFKIKSLFRSLTFSGSQNISGREENIIDEWPNQIKESNLVIYLFNADSYMSGDEKAQRKVNAQLCLVSSLVFENNHNINTNQENSNFQSTKLIIVPTWKYTFLKTHNEESSFNAFYDYVMTNAILKDTIQHNKNAKITKLVDFITFGKDGEQTCLNKKDLNYLCETIIRMYK